MRVTLPTLFAAGVIFRDDCDEEYTTYIVSDGYCVSYDGFDVKVLQHVHVEGEGDFFEDESISMLDAHFEHADDPIILDVDTDIGQTEFNVRIYKEISEL